jgi:hypothetical protein
MGSNRAGARVKARKARRIKNDRKIAEAAQKKAAAAKTK